MSPKTTSELWGWSLCVLACVHACVRVCVYACVCVFCVVTIWTESWSRREVVAGLDLVQQTLPPCLSLSCFLAFLSDGICMMPNQQHAELPQETPSILRCRKITSQWVWERKRYPVIIYTSASRLSSNINPSWRSDCCQNTCEECLCDQMWAWKCKEEVIHTLFKEQRNLEKCRHNITFSPMDLLQWMGAVRRRVQTADKNNTIIPQVIHTTPVHQLLSCEVKSRMFVRFYIILLYSLKIHLILIRREICSFSSKYIYIYIC